MKERLRCKVCGEINHNSIHTTDHDFVDPRPVGMSPVGKRMQRFNSSPEGKEYRAHVKELGEGETACQINSPVCQGIARHIHEDKTRGKSGGIDAAIRKGTQLIDACDPCNGYCSENQVWAREHGFIVRARDIDKRMKEIDL